jgi:GNAT superfamily N-acetyltransferase
MDITDEHGLSVALVTSGELTTRPWLDSERHIDVVRMSAPRTEVVDDLVDIGFIRKPALLSWTAELGLSETEFLSRLDNKSRQDIRRARARAERALRLTVHDRIEPGILDRFLALYRERVEAMPYGITIACRQRERFLDGREKYFAVLALEGDELVGGCLVLECPGQDTVRIRFSAVTERWRRDSLARTLYFAAMRTAREKGYRWATLGDEPNLYGHLTKAGLFSFKVKMGFRCVPSQDFHDPEGCDLADLVLNLTHLCNPCLILGYAPDPFDNRSLTAHLITDTPTDPQRFAAPFLAGVEQRSPGSAELRRFLA